nr:ABC transporter ATP-binding protein/permease [uncultured Merdimonas sp.]
MLQIRHICKEYRTGSLVQKALDDVSLNLRDNEFVAILGPSGSGKTTLLNIIGGLDRYDSGDLIINGISTREYKDRDWDSYRNHTIGFVFQSYNLIPHQTILSNVELALTISGIDKAERVRRAREALEEVGLGEQIHKKPNQLSGGQMQRVAIARALVNDPDILLADEPTGALDSDTSVQVMDLLKEVARDRLVVMVTHNPELAQQYATRIVNLRDGKIRSDSDAFEIDETEMKEPEHKNMGKSSMSFLTALALSFNNLKTKKARTLLTSFAGSIGIIGIALILALSTGVNAYIQSIEEETLSEYPLQIQSAGFDLTSMMMTDDSKEKSEKDKGDVSVIQMVTDMFSSMDSNDLKSLKSYLDSGESDINKYTNAIEYSYNVTPQIYLQEEDGVRQVHPDNSFAAMGISSSNSSNSMMSSMMSTDMFYEMPEDTDLYEGQYDVKAGRWPENYNECVVVLTPGGSISDFLLYTLGLRDEEELERMVQQFVNEETIEVPDKIRDYSYDEILGVRFKLVNSSDYYTYDEQYQVWRDKRDDTAYMENLAENGEDMEIVGIVKPSEDANGTLLTTGIGYLPSLTKHVVEKAAGSEIVQKQLENPQVNVFTNEPFGAESDENEFDTGSLFTVDEEALQKAFQFDDSALSGSFDFSSAFGQAAGTMDLSGMVDLSGISIQLPETPDLNMSELMQGVDISVSQEGMESLISDLMNGYQNYQQSNPGAGYKELTDDFTEFLNTDVAKAIIKENVDKIVAEGGEVLTSEQLQKLASDLIQGYREYAAEFGKTDPDDITAHFQEYLSSSEAQGILSSGLVGMVDTTGVEEQISGALKGYLTQSLSAYTGTMAQALETQISSAMQQMMQQLASGMQGAMTQAMRQIGNSLQNAMNIDADAFADAFQMNMDAEDLTELMMSMSQTETASYENNLRDLGYADFSEPSGIDIYPKDFEAKEQVVNILDNYNAQMEEEGKDEQVITYTDMVGALMSSVTTIIDTISYVLIAFVSISLIVSSIMIGVITYISVLERRKEIGILRAIGASKGNISQVFNAETVIIGFCAGLIGIIISLLLLIPGNALIHYLAGTNDVSAVLPVGPAVILILLSVVLTLIGGLIPSRKAAKSDPVTALRTE